MGFFDDKVKLVTPVFSRPDYLGTGEFTVQIKKMEEIPLTAQKKVEGAAILITILKSSNAEKYKVGQDCSLTFLSGKSEGFLRLKRFFKEVIGATDSELENPMFYKEHFPKEGKAPLEGCVFEVSGRDKLNKDKTQTYTEFKFGEGRFEE